MTCFHLNKYIGVTFPPKFTCLTAGAALCVEPHDHSRLGASLISWLSTW